MYGMGTYLREARTEVGLAGKANFWPARKLEPAATEVLAVIARAAIAEIEQLLPNCKLEGRNCRAELRESAKGARRGVECRASCLVCLRGSLWSRAPGFRRCLRQSPPGWPDNAAHRLIRSPVALSQSLLPFFRSTKDHHYGSGNPLR